MIVLDTNVVSELMRPEPADRVRVWADTKAAVAVTAVTVAELLYGLARLPHGARRAQLEQAARWLVDEEFAGRVLPSTAQRPSTTPTWLLTATGGADLWASPTRRSRRSADLAAPGWRPATPATSRRRASASSTRGPWTPASDPVSRRIDTHGPRPKGSLHDHAVSTGHSTAQPSRA